MKPPAAERLLVRIVEPEVADHHVIALHAYLAHFVRRVGEEEAPAIAGFYVAHNARWYVVKMHPVSALLADAEKLRTEWATDRRVTSGDAREAEVFDEMRAKSRRVDQIIAELDAAEGKS